MWRRDSAALSRTPIRRSSSLLRSSRCFSKSRPTHARHNDDSDSNGNKKPEGISDLEWMRQQHLARWRKRIEEDPYRALFGASEEMLRGRGLEGYLARQRQWRKGLEWVEKTFPKWTLKDMRLGERCTDNENKKTKEEESYPKKVKIDGRDEAQTKDRKTMYPEPSYRTGKFERDLWNSGVESPSDLRRPREVPMGEAGDFLRSCHSLKKEMRSRESIKSAKEAKPQSNAQANELPPSDKLASELKSTLNNDTQLGKEAVARESSFIEEFLVGKTLSAVPTRYGRTGSEDWRQTTLERRATSGIALKPRRKTSVSIIDVAAKDRARAEKRVGFEGDEKPMILSHGTSDSRLDNEVAEESSSQNYKTAEKTSSAVSERSNENSSSESTQEPLTETKTYNSLASGTDTTGNIEIPAQHRKEWLPRINTDGWLVTRENAGSPSVIPHQESPTESITHQPPSTVSEATKDVESTDQHKELPHPKISTDWLPTPTPRKDMRKKLDDHPDSKDRASPKDLPFGARKPAAAADSHRSTTKILEQLPEDDLDLLTAENIRARMGRTKGTNEDKNIVRQKLEEEFKKDVPQLEPAIQAKVLSDQHARRKLSQFAREVAQTEPAEEEKATATSEHKGENTDAKPISVLETSLDFMSRWLHTGGNVLAQHFWQDPVQLTVGQLSGADEEFFKGIGIGVLKGRRAFATIKEDLLTCVPAAEELVKRLNRDEIKASAGAVRLYREVPSALKDTSDAAASRAAAHNRIGKLRQALLETDTQFKKACESVDGMKSGTKPTLLAGKHLKIAADILEKNVRLTRMAVFGLQARIEVEAGTPGGLVARELLHRLLALQDTQLALSKLVLRAMQILRINPKAEEEHSTKSVQPSVDLADPSVVEALASVASKDSSAKQSIDTVTANEKLKEEISKQKAAMRGLSDDGYTRPPRPVVRKSFDRETPLAHSLFRPFSSQLESLGKNAEDEEGVIDKAQKEKDDRELIKEVRKAYEDVYGEITVDHRQVPPSETPSPVAEGTSEMSEGKDTKQQASIQMLKEDDVSPSIMAEASKPDTSTVPSPKEDSGADKSISEASTTSETPGDNKHDAIENVRPLDQNTNGGPIPQNSSQQSDSATSSIPALAAWASEHYPISQLKDDHGASPNCEYTYDASTDEYTPIEYKTLIYNAETDKLSITTSEVPQPNPPISTIPLHEALATLSHPAKFVDHLPKAFHVVAVKPDVLTLRTASLISGRPDRNITSIVDKKEAEEATEGWRGINPVDGTTTLSPTGFVSVSSGEEFEERRRLAEEYHKEARKTSDSTEKKRRGKVGVGGVVKTAIWAGAWCYVIGVLAEVVK